MNAFSPTALRDTLAAIDAQAAARRLCVALSGGLDSTVLLEALCRLRDRLPGDGLRAIHVHHGLHQDADGWARHCEALCVRLGVPLTVLRVDARPAPGESPEARAREVRYAALAEALERGEALLTAHHADDQLETVLIQLLRGAGVAGLAAMPAAASFGPGLHLRPLLGFTRAALADWAAREGLSGWLLDPANEELRYARNHLRSEVLPALRAHWPGAAAAAGRSARHCAEASGLLDELAALDAAHCVAGHAIRLSALRGLSAGRQRNLARWQARQLGLAVPDERRLATLLAQVLEAAPDAQPQVEWGEVVALRHGDLLWLAPAHALPEPAGALDWPDPRQPLALGPGLGTLALVPSDRGGLAGKALAAGPWRVVARRGGERLELPGRAGSRALKKLLQDAGVPPWIRTRMPLLEIGGALAAAGAQWVDAAWWAPAGEPAWRLRWERCELPGAEEFIVGGAAFC
ncbi:tRNA lysidine(34) synthetase TilS [Thioalkalivibrio sp. XN279]|uniref:tRNA lysidine(34) synthetase TilS n=1 Tax=Thioalkalivibrio sp. XN279 TaxID=2714953 RepID=UPI00140C10FF|nr:tRNA lysidine(34) synthetase TilS [Thioalkalivibrio sp. XN279]NHA15286.1 tRNA lysidine(34) synthetase TilS [Thioalkalivibrio sp. XN279]